MKYTFPEFSGSWSLREARLVFDEMSGEIMRQNLEKLGPRAAQVILHLHEAARESGDVKLAKLLEDEQTQRMIAGQPELLEGELSVKWLEEITITFLKKSHEAFGVGEGKVLEAAKTCSTKESKACAEIFRKTIAEVKKAEGKDAFGSELPGFEGGEDSVVMQLLRRGADSEKIKARWDKLIELQKEIIRASDDVINNTSVWKEKLSDAGVSSSRLKEIDDAADTPARRAKTLELLKSAAGALEENERKLVEDAIRDLETKIAELKGDERSHIQSRFEARIRYMDCFGGTNQEAIIRLALQDNGKLRDDILIKQLEILRKDVLIPEQKKLLKESLGWKEDAAGKWKCSEVKLVSEDECKNIDEKKRGDVQKALKEQVERIKKKYGIANDTELKNLVAILLDSGRNALQAEWKSLAKPKSISLEVFAQDLLALWSTEAAETYLREQLVANPTGISLSALALRARMPDDVLKTLSDGHYNADVGLLIAVAKFPKFGDGGNVGEDAAKVIVENVTEPTATSGQFRLKSRQLLLDYLTFICFKDKEDDAKSEAETLLTSLTGPTKEIHKQSDESFLVEKDKLVIALQNRPVTSAKTIYDAMKREHVDTVTWKEAGSMYASELWKIAKVGTDKWYDYITTSLPRNFWDADGDADLLKLLHKQDSLIAGEKALEGLLAQSNAGEKILERTEKDFQKLKTDQEKALHGDPATSPSEHVTQAHALLLANQYVIGQLNTLQWNTRSLRLRQLTLWLAMHKGTKKDPEAGLALAKEVLNKAADRVTPEDQEKYVDDYLTSMSDGDRAAFQKYADACGLVENQEGRDILSPLKQRGLTLKPQPLDILLQVPDPANPALKLAGGVGRWLIDAPEKVSTSLALVLEDSSAKEAYIKAFVTKTPQEYTFHGRTEKVSVTDAHIAVNAIQEHLLFEMGGRRKAREEMKQEEEFSNPVDRWLRTGVEAMKDLWNTDMVGKVEVAAMLFAAFWMIKEAWKSKKGKFVLLGIPILLGVNAIVKQRTGRDLLGENLKWKSKEDRQFPMEQFKRRGAVLNNRYAFLTQRVGQLSIDALMDRKSPVSVADLLEWRKAVKSTGGENFAAGAPKSLHISEIENDPAAGSRDKAYQFAYFAFEAQCIDVARLNGHTGGSLQDNAEQGADLIQRRYVDARKKGKGSSLPPATMFEVLMSECQMPTKEMLENKTYLEAAADMFGYTYGEAERLVKKYGTKAWVMMKQGMHKAPEVAGAVTDWAWDKGGKIHDWARLTYAKLGQEIPADFAAAWKFVVETGTSIGMTVVTKGPGVVEFVFSGAINLTERTIGEIRKIHAYLLTMPEMNPVKSFEETLARVFGVDLLAELTSEEAEKQILVDENALTLLYAGEDYLMRDTRLPVGISINELYQTKLSEKIQFRKGGDVILRAEVYELLFDKPSSDPAVAIVVKPLAASNVIAQNLYTKNYRELTSPAKKRRVLEIIQANIFQKLCSRDEFKQAVSRHEDNLSTAKDETKRLKDQWESLVKDVKTFRDHLHKIRANYQLAWETDEATLQDKKKNVDRDIKLKTDAMLTKQAALTKLQNVDTSKFNRVEVKIHEGKIKVIELEITSLNKGLGELKELGDKLPVYIKIAHLPKAARNPTGVKAALFTSFRGVEPVVFAEAEKLYVDFQNTTKSLSDAVTAEKTTGEAWKIADEKEKKIKAKGAEVASIDTAIIFTNWDANILEQAAGTRESSLLVPAYFEPYNVVGVSLEVALGDAKEAAKTRIRVWKTFMLENDRAFREAKIRGTPDDLDQISAYERYLDNVALNEAFLHVLLASPDGGKGENVNPLHLSLFEGRRLDRYLAERSRLITFTRFKEAQK